MPLFRRRPLMRAAMVGGGAYMAGKHVAHKQEAEAEQNEQIADLQQQQQQYAPPAAPAAAPAAPAESREDAIAQLKDLKGLLDSGVLTQAEFDAQKTKILGEMS